MTGTRFLADWLALRESADARARNQPVAGALRSWFLQRSSLAVVDLGCGTGANLRAIAPLLPDRQTWRLIDHDGALLAIAREGLSAWADAAEARGEAVVLSKGAARIEVTFVRADLAADLKTALAANGAAKPDLITAAALFDLASEAFIRRFAACAERHRAAVYAVLTYNGQQTWSPRHPTDREMLQAFHSHQMSDKGFGVSVGPAAAVELSEALTAQGFSVTEGASPWRLGVGDTALIAELAAGFARAVAETRAIPGREVETWLARPRTGGEVGHIDIFATPPSGAAVDMTGGDDEE